MKTLRKTTVILLISLIMLQAFPVLADDSVINTEYDPTTMSLEERRLWVLENVEPSFTGTATYIARNEWLYTGVHTSYAENTLYTIGKLETQLKFLCNQQFTEVVDWSNNVFRATGLIDNVIIDTDYHATRMFPDNVSVVYEAWFAQAEGAYLIEHWYNLHGDGDFEIRVVKSFI